MNSYNNSVEFVTVERGSNLESVKTLFEEYANSLGVDLSFQGFQDELKNLPGDYVKPGGSIILAKVEGLPAGCVAMKKIDSNICEMKRLYLREQYKGFGLGKDLALKIIERARELGYSYMRLDTLPTMDKAQKLYKALGFYDIDAYVFNPIEGTRFLELKL